MKLQPRAAWTVAGAVGLGTIACVLISTVSPGVLWLGDMFGGARPQNRYEFLAPRIARQCEGAPPVLVITKVPLSFSSGIDHVPLIVRPFGPSVPS